MVTLRAALVGIGWGGLVLSAAPMVSAQTAPPAFDALRTPPSPAFALLGIEPSAVERPATPSDAAVTLINKVGDFTVPRNFAFESSPYWLVSRPHVTWRDDATRTLAQSLARTTSVSIGSAETGDEKAPVTSLAMGFRTLVASGHVTAETTKQLEALEKRLAAQGDLLLSFLRERGFGALESALLDCTSPRPPAPPVTEDVRTACAADFEVKKRALIDVVTQSDEFKKAAAPLLGARAVVPKREGFLLEVAAAAVWDYPNAEWEADKFRRGAVWATPSYAAGPWTVLGVVRYEDDALAANEDVVDWGGRAIYSTPDYAVSLEYVERSPVGPAVTLERSHRLVGIAEYRVMSGTWLVASFGKDRQRTSAAGSTLVAQLGLAFSFSKERYKF